MKKLRCGIDTGGTFTDIITVDNDTATLYVKKIPSTPINPANVFKTALEYIKTFPDYEKLNYLCHGTTVGINAILQGNFEPIALLATKGFTDVLEIANQRRPHLYSLHSQKRKILVPKETRYPINERIAANGTIITKLDTNIENIFQDIVNRNIHSVAISFLNSYNNSKHEEIIANILDKKAETQKYPLFISRSSDVCPIIREYSRTLTTVLNAIVTPKLQYYFKDLEKHILDSKLDITLRLMKSNAGVSTIKEVKDYGVHSLLGGLAGGVMAGEFVCKQLEIPNLITIDIGGTSCDVATLENSQAKIRDHLNLGEYKAIIPSTDVETIGAGGGSIAKAIDGLLTVGPDSQGADPGPACYGKGSLPTMTDANLVLGILDPDNFAGISKLQKSKSTEAIKEKIAKPLEISIEEAALGIRRILNQNMSAAIYKITVMKGRNPHDYSLCGFGGAGPLHAVDLAQSLEIPETVIPPYPGLWSAFGMLVSDLKFDKVKTVLLNLNLENLKRIKDQIYELQRELELHVLNQKIKINKAKISWKTTVQYFGQGYSIAIKVNQSYFNDDEKFIEHIKQDFQKQHQLEYGWNDEERSIQIVDIWINLVIPQPEVILPKIPIGNNNPPKAAFIKETSIYDNSQWSNAVILKKEELCAGNKVIGPAIILQNDSTTYIPNSFVGSITKYGFIIIREEKNQ